MGYIVEDYIVFIESGRFDKISNSSLEEIAIEYRKLESQVTTICYIFKYGFHEYLVNAVDMDDAWERLAKRQTKSVEYCRRKYKYLGRMADDTIWKI